MADIKYAVYKIFNGTDFDTIYFKAPALAITESDDKQFISKANKTLVTNHLTTFNTANNLVKLVDGKIPKVLINEDFGNYLDKRSESGLQNVGTEVNFEHANGITVQHGIDLNQKDATDVNTNKISAANGLIKLSVGTDTQNQEISFTKAGTLDFKKRTKINNIEIGDGDYSAVPKIYVDNAIESGAKPIESVKAATAVDFDPMPSGVTLTPDAVPVGAGDRVLLKDQPDKTKNGIYIVSTGVWTRVNEDSNLKGALVFVKEGTTNNDSKWFHKGGGDWIRFSQTDQLQFTGGLVRSDDTVSLLNGAIVNNHIKSDAAIALTKLGTHTGNATNWDAGAVATIITQGTSIDKRLTDLAMTIYRLRGDVGTVANYGEWRTGAGGSLSISAVNTVADGKQNPVRFGTASPSTTDYKKGDVYLLTDPVT